MRMRLVVHDIRAKSGRAAYRTYRFTDSHHPKDDAILRIPRRGAPILSTPELVSGMTVTRRYATMLLAEWREWVPFRGRTRHKF
jgi:hypothetical protein